MEKPEDIVQKAEKKLKAFFGGTKKFEDACDLFIKAANLFKVDKKWKEAAEAFQSAANCQLKLKSTYETASHLISSAICLLKVDKKSAIEMYKQAIDYYIEVGRFNMAAKYHKEIAEIYEKERDSSNALAHFQKAADFYSSENSESLAQQCLLKVALYSALMEEYERAINLYEEIGKAYLENNLLKYSAKENFLRAGLCHLARGDLVAAKRGYEQYQEVDITFESQRECKFLGDLITAFEEGDLEQFTNVVFDYDSLSKLDAWKTTILLRVKNKIKEETEKLLL
ncbi:alpha-soluble nsf attachment protein [Anaeramoeba ignava]|uniref:Alpha-soluble nsf attachment protein n=1 Tax=Anaeramoeba ignava TaxID=1746090 RepID=A0A9Q0LG64_ANAIG|nr:alpha-soluble nsf attachment protein [Anaeramoeba ignava]|eukprot:Anaeramoba_ignava/a616713_51.p1 GENE.a616713_51~~a616713_51.p1  ORF type:complete len:284 (-),score=96.03 a616713_51:72-923(-)